MIYTGTGSYYGNIRISGTDANAPATLGGPNVDNVTITMTYDDAVMPTAIQAELNTVFEELFFELEEEFKEENFTFKEEEIKFEEEFKFEEEKEMTFEEEMIEFFEEPVMMTMKEEEKEEFKEPPMMMEMFEESNEEEEPVMEMVMEVMQNEEKEEKKLAKRNPIAILLNLPMLRNRIIKNKKKMYDRKKQKQSDLKLF